MDFLLSAFRVIGILFLVRGRAPAKMPRFGAPGPDNAQLTAIEVADIVAFVRRWAPQSR